MTQICAGALGVGLLMAFILPILPFAGSLIVAVLLGSGLSLGYGRSVDETILPALGIFLSCQIGYGLGLAIAALGDTVLRPRRRWRRAEDPAAAKRLRPERK